MAPGISPRMQDGRTLRQSRRGAASNTHLGTVFSGKSVQSPRVPGWMMLPATSLLTTPSLRSPSVGLADAACINMDKNLGTAKPGALAPHDFRHHAARATTPGRPSYVPACPCLMSSTRACTAENLLSR
ncbi:hypothetical protein SNOG_04202 [Parastagonospora nodorum SN15]|uniref:Uncharacterized protein n=1 Tax=Phaeosphaeria nodorum (strain SN15 / ATCC MYA-4574 / FGSC 10173) TaxID=321614 RepID=Q0UVL2_PHANO|nr:hypothetical protein SNOG_04202 [Parastagonospora nodorum SN15]EAT87962.1 hypothetical protein SNOG_04202 [Parastagonospora nodorum SN15]